MEVKPGYKQTEVGVIPEEWEVDSSAVWSECRERHRSAGACHRYFERRHSVHHDRRFWRIR